MTRSADPASRRRVLLTLTPAATELIPELIDLADANDDRFFAPLAGDQRAELAGLLQSLTARARAITHDSDHEETQ